MPTYLAYPEFFHCDVVGTVLASGQMRVTFVSNIFPPTVGGPATHIYHLANTLHERGHQVRAVVCPDDPDNAVSVPFPIKRVSWNIPVALRYLLVFWHTWQAALKSDVVYINGIELPSSLAALMARRPRLLKVVGDWAWESAVRRGLTTTSIEEFQRSNHTPVIRVFRAIQRTFSRLASTIIVPSSYVRQLVIGWGIPPHKVHIVQNALTETPRIDITRNEAKQRIGLRGSLVCTVARLYAWKRVDILLEMVPAFTGDSTLVIVGDGPEQAALENRARSLGVADRVRFVGRIPHHEVHLYLRAADVFVLNTSYEGLSHTLIETRSVGTPIVTTDIGGNREILKNEETALLVPVGDPESFVAAVNRLLNSPELRQHLAQAATRGLEHFIWDRLVDETMEIIDKLTKPQPVTKPPGKA